MTLTAPVEIEPFIIPVTCVNRATGGFITETLAYALHKQGELTIVKRGKRSFVLMDELRDAVRRMAAPKVAA